MYGNKYDFEELSGKIIGSAIEVHKTLGSGFIESVYHKAMKLELTDRNITFETEKHVKIFYKKTQIGEHRVDLVVNNEIVVELKAVNDISDSHEKQIISYLKATGLKVGLILNFSKSKVDIKRIVFDF
jgi:GxxExxY protein